MLESDYQWDYGLTTEDKDKQIYGRYLLLGNGNPQVVATIKKFPPCEDYFVKLIAMLPLPFSTLKASEAFIEAYFRPAHKERLDT